MAGNRIICTENNVDYLSIRKAMSAGARTINEVVKMTGVCTECEGCGKCKTLIQNIIELGR